MLGGILETIRTLISKNLHSVQQMNSHIMISTQLFVGRVSVCECISLNREVILRGEAR